MELHEFKSFLGEPAYEDEDILIYQGDCLQLMNHLPEGCVQLTVTSPPYNIGKEYESVLESYLDLRPLAQNYDQSQEIVM